MLMMMTAKVDQIFQCTICIMVNLLSLSSRRRHILKMKLFRMQICLFFFEIGVQSTFSPFFFLEKTNEFQREVRVGRENAKTYRNVRSRRRHRRRHDWQKQRVACVV